MLSTGMFVLSNFWNDAAVIIPGVLLFCNSMISVEVMNDEDADENFVAAMSGFPSTLRSHVQRSHNSSGAENVTGAANCVAAKACVRRDGMNLSGAFTERRETLLSTSTERRVASSGTFTSMANSEEEITVPFTGPNHTSRFAGVLLNPLPVITIVSLGDALIGSTFWITGACPKSSRGKPRIIVKMKWGFMSYFFNSTGRVLIVYSQ